MRLSEYLERGRNSAIDDISITWTDDALHLTLIADNYPAVELWEAEHHALSLVEQGFNRKVHLNSLAAPSPWADLEKTAKPETSREE